MGKTLLITGGSQGIGAAIALGFAAAGYNVALGCHTERSLEKAKPVVEACRAHGVEVECFVADVASFTAAKEMVEAAHKRFGSIDVLVNNAGIIRDGLLARMSEENFDDVIDANLKSAFNTIRHTTPIMMKQRFGRIINISSVAGVSGNAAQANYSASKAGLIGLTKSVARELGSRNITCNAIAPGFIETAMLEHFGEDVRKGIIEKTSLRKIGKPENVADTAVFLAHNDFITGQVLVVDGGLMM